MITEDNKSFCILPFVHMHLNTEGDVYPCCVGWTPERETQLGWLKDSSFEELFNHPEMKKLRVDMVNGIRQPKWCRACYEHEDNGFRSARQGNNDDFKYIQDKIVASMQPDGYLDPKIKSWDIRFSSLCNLKCRSCGSLYSTSWSKEDSDFNPDEEYKEYISYEEGTDPLSNQYENVEKIYFAGGEPLITPQHFQTLKKLIEIGRSKYVKLVYNTNMTKLNYNNNNLVELWKEFKFVSLGVSIDGIGEEAEYIRNGIKWIQIEKNLKTISDVCKTHTNIRMHFATTVSVMNIMTLPELHKYLFSKGYMLEIHDILLNVLLHPTFFSIKILPKNLKIQVKEKIKNHIDWLKKNYCRQHVLDHFSSLLTYIDQEHTDSEILNFVKRTKELDYRRNQSFPEVFPHYKEWWEDITKNIITIG